jgi:putative membrane protein
VAIFAPFDRSLKAATLVLTGMVIVGGCAQSTPDRMERSSASSSTIGSQVSTRPNLSDANIVSLLAIANKSDIEGGQLAQTKAADPQVRSYGTRMVNDHQAMLDQGQQLSKQLMVNPMEPELGQQLLSDHERSMQLLQGKSGEQFDRAYIDHEIQMHQKIIQLVQQAEGSARAPQLRQLLQQSKPALENHLQQAQQVKQAMMASR